MFKTIIRRLAVYAAVLAVVVVGAGLLASSSTPAAYAATCRTTHSYSHTLTSTGSQSWTWRTRAACGRSYQEWEHHVFYSSAGSHYTEDIYKNEPRPPHYWKHTHKVETSKRGRVTVTDSYRSA